MSVHVPNSVGQRVAVVHQPGMPAPMSELLDRNFEVVRVPVRRDMLRELVDAGAAAIVVDHASGEFDVQRVCRDVRTVVSTRLMVISSCVAGEESAQIEALDAGADDVVSSSVSPNVLLARVRAMLRAAEPYTRVVLIQLGDLRIDLDAHVVFIGRVTAPCRHAQFKLLVLLARRPEVLVTRQEIVAELWGEVDPSFPKKARLAVSALRRMLGSAEGVALSVPTIDAVSKVGYRLSPPRGRAVSSWMTTSEGRRLPLTQN